MKGDALAAVAETEDCRAVRAWDLPTRLFHWTLVLLILLSWASVRYAEAIGDPLLKVHRWSGLAILTLVLWRLLWGAFGSSTSRFASFVRSPVTALAYLRDLAVGRERRFLGHNPAGAVMVLLLLGLVATQGLLGLFTVEHNDLTAGPLYRLIPEEWLKGIAGWHRRMLYYVLLPAIVLHVAANVLYGLVKREPLVVAMVTGRKPALAYEDGREAEIPTRPLLRASGLLVLSAGIVLGGIAMLGGRLF